MKPFLRWAGGKNWLIKHLDGILGETAFNNYHEPFLGGGAVFFHLETEGEIFLSDLNAELINTYQQIRDAAEAVIAHLQDYRNTEDFYYEIRHQVFENPIERAAQFIYLNQTSFNGIYRVNLQGQYNVPYGYRNKDFIQQDLLLLASEKLGGAQIYSGQFDDGIENIQQGDLVFLDPPYTITHNNNGFIKYNERLFSEEDQNRLAGFINQIIEADAFYILTNAAHQDIRRIFNMNEPLELSRASLVGGKKAKRGKYEEYLFTNIPINEVNANQ